MLIFACLSVKGGAGKSTVATNLGLEFMRRGRRVLVVDADPQGTTRVWSEIAAESGHQAPTVVAMGKNMARPGQLDKMAESFDVVGIDCPGRDGAVVRAALMVADVALIPCGASPADAWALTQTLELIEEARALRPQLASAVVVTRRRHTSIGLGARNDLAQAGVPVLAVELCERVAYQQAMGQGTGVIHLKDREASREVEQLAEELLTLTKDKADEASISDVA